MAHIYDVLKHIWHTAHYSSYNFTISTKNGLFMVDNNKGNHKNKTSKIYINVDHLKEGLYQLHLLKENKVIKKLNFKK